MKFRYQRRTYYPVRKSYFQTPFGDFAAKVKGSMGEFMTSFVAKRIFKRGDAMTMRNLYLPWPDGKTAQIDEVLIAESGIYIIEVKNYKGWIFGNEKNEYWTQVLPAGYTGGTIKNRFYNPVKQNAGHIACIRRNLGDYKGPVHSIIVFGNGAEFKNVTITSNDVHVIYQSFLSHTVREIDARHRDHLLSREEIHSIYTRLLQAGETANRKDHKEQVKTHVAIKNEREAQSLCPRCGAPLVVRTAKNGTNAGFRFFGCSNYPKCRYTKSLD